MKKLKKTALILSCVLILASCREKEEPDGLLSKERMTDLLYELTLLSSIQNTYHTSKDTIRLQTTPKKLLEKYGLDSTAFVQQHQYYMKNTELYEELFDSVYNRINKDIKETEALPDDPKDSLQIEMLKKLN